MATGKPYQRNGHTIHLGHYTLDSIAINGTVKAGCHVVEYDEIKRIEALLPLTYLQQAQAQENEEVTQP